MKQFTVYESLISSNSAFFANALGRDWKEARERVVPLPENEPEVFRLYLTYLYVGDCLSLIGFADVNKCRLPSYLSSLLPARKRALRIVKMAKEIRREPPRTSTSRSASCRRDDQKHRARCTRRPC